MPEFDPAAQGVAGDTFVLLPNGQPWPDAGELDIWLSQVTADYSTFTSGHTGLRPDVTLEPDIGLKPDISTL